MLNSCWSRVSLNLVQIVVLFKFRASIVFLLLFSGFHGLLLFSDGLRFVSNGLPRASRSSDGFDFLYFIPLRFGKPEEARFKQREARRETKEARGSPAETIGEQWKPEIWIEHHFNISSPRLSPKCPRNWQQYQPFVTSQLAMICVH